jgi:hypothetical protein
MTVAALHDAYLAAVITRLEHLLKVQAAIWLETVAVAKPDHLWGVPQIGTGEIRAIAELPTLGPLAAPALPPAAERHLAAATQLASKLTRARAGATSSRLLGIEEAFGLDAAERDLLVLALLPELDQRYRRMLAYLADDASQPWPLVELALAVLAPIHDAGAREEGTSVAWRALAPDAPLRWHGLTELVPPVGGSAQNPLAQHALRIAPDTLTWLLNGPAVDYSLLPDADLSRPAPETTPIAADLEAALAAAGRLASEPKPLLVRLLGPSASDAWPGRCLASEARRPLLRWPVTGDADGLLARRLEAALRSARLAGAILLLPGLETLAEGAFPACQRLLARRLPEHPLPVVVPTRLELAAELLPGPGAMPEVTVRCPLPGYAARERIWKDRLARVRLARDVDARELAAQLADRFQLTADQIDAGCAGALSAARLIEPDHPAVGADALFAACRRLATARLSGLARRVAPEGRLELGDLVLPPATRSRLLELVARLKQRQRIASLAGFHDRLLLGRGTVALFAGAAGTGKTMAAMLIGREIGADLLKADLAALVSKYVGETEKHLDRLFAEAEAANAVLFFDEADALFGRRGEVKEARDRWANLEINYLLQRIEEFDGVVILATNLRQNLDEAFARRLDVVIDFPFPDAALRAQLWRGLIPHGLTAPPEHELHALAEAFPLAGGNIKAIVVAAAFRACAEESQPATARAPRPDLSLRHLVIGVAREHEKLGKPVTQAEFGAEWHGWVQQAAQAAGREALVTRGGDQSAHAA